jgi:type III restriction enzyme
MNIIFKQYQKQAIDRIFGKSVTFLKKGRKENNEDWKIIFRAPTGSGKTLMTSKIIERIAFEYDEDTSFIWLSKGQLADQSKNSFQKYLGGGGMRFSSIDEISDNEIKNNEILFTNWEKLFTKATRDNPVKDIKRGDYTNIFMRNNEQDRNLRVFCKNTRKENRKIVLIIDESHLNITEGALEIIEEIIQPDLRIDITATPKNNIAYDYGDRDGEFVTLKEVREQKMIKQEVVINPDLDEDTISKSELDGDTLVLHEAVRKRDELLKLYKSENSQIKPLVLIQLPNNNQTLSATDKQKIDFVEKVLMTEFDVSYENGKMAKWLSDNKDKRNLDDITENDSSVEFLIFKQAIATGWDCPRAHILVKFRETGTATFEIQTVGRIMRMPEFKHYKNEDLNRAYVYANLSEINIHQDAFEYIKDQQSKRLDKYSNVDLKSTYLKRSEYNDILHDYQNFLFEELIEKIKGDKDIKKAKENYKKFLKLSSVSGDTINLKTTLSESIILDAKISNIDQEQEVDHSNVGNVRKSEFDTNNYFMSFLSEHTGEFQQARSKGKIKIALYQALEKYLGMTCTKEDMQKIILNNKWFFIDLIDSSVEKYAKTRLKKDRTEKVNDKWNVPEKEFLPKNYTEKKVEKCAVSPFYTGPFQTENGFIDNYLEFTNKVEWWYQNGEKNEVYFGIPYTDERGKKNNFYPDFIVKYKDGRVGIFDTKKGSTADSEDTKLKANSLSKYIESENKKGKKLFGGIVVPDDKNESFKLNENKKRSYSYPEGDWISI